MRAGFDEVVVAAMCEGKTRLIGCENFAGLSRRTIDMFAFVLPDVVVKVTHLMTEVFLLSCTAGGKHG